MASSAVVIIKQ